MNIKVEVPVQEALEVVLASLTAEARVRLDEVGQSLDKGYYYAASAHADSLLAMLRGLVELRCLPNPS